MVENIDLDILKFMSERGNYESYHGIINKALCTKESWQLLTDFGAYYEEFPDKEEIDDEFDIWFRVTRHPGWKPDRQKMFGQIVSNAKAHNAPSGQVFLTQLERLRFEQRLRAGIDDLSTGSGSPDTILSDLERTLKASTVAETTEDIDLEYLAKHQRSGDGLYFRCEDLNRSIGPVGRGDFTLIGKRPEVGGTSFLCSEMSFMLEQLPPGSNAVFFNNEEVADKVYPRMVGAALNKDYRTIMANPTQTKQEYEDWLDGRTWDLKHNTSMDLGFIHRTLRGKKYDLIGINVLAKVGGTDRKEDHDKLEALGQEMRRIAEQHGPVLAVVQADPSAEGMAYIPQDRIYKSKTALQGEADVLIMIGMTNDEQAPYTQRFIHVAKNKIPPAPCCDLSCKHIKSEVYFDVATGRFTSCTFTDKQHSRP